MEKSTTEISYSKSNSLTTRTFRIVYYSIMVILHLHVDNVSRTLYKHLSLLQHFSFNTNMSFYLNQFYFMYVLLIHLPFGNKLKNSKILEVYSKLSFSISFLVFSIYWAMIAINPSLILSDHKNRLLPLQYDLFLHGANFIFNLIEHLYIFPKSNTKKIGFFILTSFYTLYLTYLMILFYVFEVVTYPLIGMMNFYQFVILLLSAVVLSNTGSWIYGLLTKYEKNEKTKQI
jgi:hypothetical protein